MNTVLKQICELLQSGERDIRWAAARVLKEIHAEEAGVVKALGEALKKEADPLLRGFLVDLAGKSRASEFLPYLLLCLSETSFNREKVIEALVAHSKAAVSELLKRYDKASEGEQRTILEILAKIRTKEALEFMFESMRKRPQLDHLKFVCMLFKGPIEALKKADQSWFRDRLVKFLKQIKENETLTTSALILAGFLRDLRMQNMLLDVLHGAKSRHVKRHALVALGRLPLEAKGQGAIVRELLPLLMDSDYLSVVEPAVRVLERVEFSKPFEKEVTKLLESPYSAVRALALSKLGSFSSQENIKRLIECLGAPDYRIREAAKRSLEKMPDAIKPLLAIFDTCQESERLDQILSVLKSQRQEFKKSQLLNLYAASQKLFLKKDERFKRYLMLIRHLDAEFLHDQIMSQYKRLKSKRKWFEAADCLSWLEGSMFLNEELRYEMSVCLIAASKKDLSSTARDNDKGLLILQALVRSNWAETLKRILKEKAFGPAELYHVGFHFSERALELKNFGTSILKALASSKKAGKFKKLAMSKLQGLV